MASPARVRLLLGGAGAIVLGAVALTVPVPRRGQPACESPVSAAARAEATLPALGVLWGRVRGWERVGGGWTVFWQPAHGMWLVRAWVPDGGGEICWRIEAAPWLPGVRLSARAASALAGRDAGTAQPRERLARRDWLTGGTRLLGALPAGGELPARKPGPERVAEAVLVGLLLAGAAARHLVPGSPSLLWRQVVGWAAALLVPLLPWLSSVAAPAFQPGVRPWVGEVAFGTAVTVLLGALLFAAQRFPAVAGSAPTAWLPAALAAGVLAGRLEPGEWLLSVAGLTFGVPALAALAVLSGWLAGLAADGLRELLRFMGAARSVALAGLGIGAVVAAGPWLGVAVAVVPAAAGDRGRGTWLTTAAVWGWFVGSLLALAEWESALLDALALLLLAAGVAAVAAITTGGTGSREASEGGRRARRKGRLDSVCGYHRRVRTAWFIAVRLLRRQGTALLRTSALAALLAVALGVASLVVVLALMSGYSAALRDGVLAASGQLVILTAPGMPAEQVASAAARVAAIPGVTRVGAVVYLPGMLFPRAGGSAELVSVRAGASPPPFAHLDVVDAGGPLPVAARRSALRAGSARKPAMCWRSKWRPEASAADGHGPGRAGLLHRLFGARREVRGGGPGSVCAVACRRCRSADSRRGSRTRTGPKRCATVSRRPAAGDPSSRRGRRATATSSPRCAGRRSLSGWCSLSCLGSAPSRWRPPSW